MATEQPMSSEMFWEIIDSTIEHEAIPQRQLSSLRSTLSNLTPDEIVAFEQAFTRKLWRAYTWDLWGAAHVAHGGASDDAFEYFRRWLVSKGRHVYDTVLRNPDDLADLIEAGTSGVTPGEDGVFEFEAIYYVALDVWGAKTGKDFYAVGSDFPEGSDGPTELSGTPFEDDVEHLSQRCPKLWRIFGENPLPHY